MEDSRTAQKNPSGEWWNIYTYQQLLQIIKNIILQENGTLTTCSKVLLQMDWKANKKLGYEWEEKGVLTKFLPLVIVLPSHSTFCNITTSCQSNDPFIIFEKKKLTLSLSASVWLRKKGPQSPTYPSQYHQRKNEFHPNQHHSKKRVN